MTAQYLLGAAPVADIYTEYDCFAYFYNKYWTINAPLYLEKALDILLLEKLEENARRYCVIQKNVLPLHPQSPKWRDSSAG